MTDAPDRARPPARAGHGPASAFEGMSPQERRARHARVSRSLERLGDPGLRALLERGTRLGAGIGGLTLAVDVDGVSVFVKYVPLTDLERQPQHRGSTANTFGLPAFCHYGIGGPGFGAWRELAMLTKTTRAVLDGPTSMFPLTYHWRVLSDVAVETPDELRDVDAVVAYWDHSPQVRTRLQALADSTAVVAVFAEHLPHTLDRWLTDQAGLGDQAIDTALRMAEDRLQAGVAWMNTQGWLHVDAHFDNILTDGQDLYFADFGLALADDFDLSPDERAFVARHGSFDASYVLAQLVRWVIATFSPADLPDRGAVIEAALDGVTPPGLPPCAASLLTRYAPIAHIVWPFYRDLQTRSRHAVYPDQPVRQALLDLRADGPLR